MALELSLRGVRGDNNNYLCVPSCVATARTNDNDMPCGMRYAVMHQQTRYRVEEEVAYRISGQAGVSTTLCQVVDWYLQLICA